MKYLSQLFIFLLFSNSIYSQNEKIFLTLDSVIANKVQYETLKKEQIKKLSNNLYDITNKSTTQQFRIYKKLHQAYFTFNYDSAMVYALKLLKTANKKQDISLISYAKIKLSTSLLASGIYNEAKDTLRTINANNLPDSLKLSFYYNYSRLYFDMSDYYQDSFYSDNYINIGLQYLDSAIVVVDKHSADYFSLSGLKNVKSGKFTNALVDFEYLFENFNITGRQFAIDASTYSYALEQKQNIPESIKFKISAAIEDIILANKENVALIQLATALFKEGNISKSSEYLKVALDDARSYGAALRKFQISQIQPIIEATKLQISESQNLRIKRYAQLVTFLSLFIVLIIFLLFKQLRKIKRAKYEINESNIALQITNNKLREVNLIKEEYIGYFFKTNSDLIDKLENYMQAVDNKISTNKINEIRSLLSKNKINQEREELYRIFDTVFLNIFPDFVKSFNALFDDENRPTGLNTNHLNTDLRIFALIRLGICDTKKIAQILNYSDNTINTYKTRIKNKAIVPNEEFEKEILKIQSI